MFNGIEEGSVVRIKFKPIPEVTKAMKMTSTLRFMSEYDIGSNVNALVLGGDFIVVDIESAKATVEPHIEIDNHHDGGTFTVFPELVDTIEIIEVGNKFASEEHGILIIQVDDKLYINGEVLNNGQPDWAEEDRDQLDKFMKFMEKFMIARAFEGELEGDGDDEENKEL